MNYKKITFDEMPNCMSEILARLEKIEAKMNATSEPLEHPPDPKPYIYGIRGLAGFLNCSVVTAQKIKNSGRIPYSQVGRKIIFRKADVLDALSKQSKSKARSHGK